MQPITQKHAGCKSHLGCVDARVDHDGQDGGVDELRQEQLVGKARLLRAAAPRRARHAVFSRSKHVLIDVFT